MRTYDGSVVVLLVEAACKAWNGDHETALAHIAEAVAVLDRGSDQGRSGTAVRLPVDSSPKRGALLMWQTRRVLAHVEANLHRRISVEELARLVGLSSSHFCRRFRCALGVAPRNYVLRRRIRVAQQLMLTTAEPLCAIAVSCGMCDQSHFTRLFHGIVGETPHTWRRARRGLLKIRRPGGEPSRNVRQIAQAPYRLHVR